MDDAIARRRLLLVRVEGMNDDAIARRRLLLVRVEGMNDASARRRTLVLRKRLCAAHTAQLVLLLMLLYCIPLGL